MSNRIGADGLSGCFRCGLVWRPRDPETERCRRCKSRLWDTPVLRPVRQGSGLGVADLLFPKRTKLYALLRRHKARNPRAFGSLVRGEGDRHSDVDLLVDFDSDASAFDQMDLITELEDLFGRRVDVAEPTGLHWLIRPQVLFEAEPV